MHRPGPSLVDVGKVGTKGPNTQTTPAGGEGSGPTPLRPHGARRLVETSEGKTRYFEYGSNDVGSKAQYYHSLLAAPAASQRWSLLRKGGFALENDGAIEEDLDSSAGGACILLSFTIGTKLS